ncbi:MAG: isoaspartyl peptidase/L-asparaginase [Caldisphaeraceae archaeon]|nr:isoaspartyl peptidase/L-asparaginase [Caldisphaeraceae archaeon]
MVIEGYGFRKGPVLLVHGGAGSWKNVESLETLKSVLRDALKYGFESSNKGNCIDMVVEAVRVMEDSNLLNAGLGSTLDYSGNVTMDAGIAYGKDKAVGAVAAVTYPRNPIKLARFVLEKTPHAIIAGQYGDELARRIGLEKHPGPSKRSIDLWKKILSEKGSINDEFIKDRIMAAEKIGYDTVGAVALDKENYLCAAVSTGGVTLKLPGRVGDSPIFGAGYYANDEVAVASTGIGEIIMISLLSFSVSVEYRRTNDLQLSIKNLIETVSKEFGRNTVGMIGIDHKGNIAAGYNTEAMPWGYIDESGSTVLAGLPKL